MCHGDRWALDVERWLLHESIECLVCRSSRKAFNCGNGLVGIVQDEGNFADSSAIEKGKEMEGTVAVMRNLYFDIALMKPF